MDDGICAFEVATVRLGIPIEEIGDPHALDQPTPCVPIARVQQDQVVPAPKLGEQLRADVSGRADNDDSLLLTYAGTSPLQCPSVAGSTHVGYGRSG